MRILCAAAASLALATSVSIAAEPESMPGIVWSPRGAVLTRVDAVSRVALPDAERVVLGHAHYAVSSSPDGALMASASGFQRRVVLSDLESLGRTWTVGPLSGQISATYWIGRRTLVAVTSGDTIALLDARTHTLRREIPAGGTIVADAATTGRYAALVAPPGRLGALRLVSVTAAGRVRTLAVPALRGGRAIDHARSVRMALPGLALSPGGRHVYIVARGNRIVVADLGAGSARVIVVRGDRTLQSAAKLAAGWQRTTRLLGSSTLVSTGSDLSGHQYAGLLGGVPAGVRLTDLTTRRTHVAVPGANQFRICGGLVVAARSTAEAGAAGIVGLDRAGTTQWSQFSGQGTLLAGCSARYVYLRIAGSGVATLDARSGAVIETHRGSVASLVESL